MKLLLIQYSWYHGKIDRGSAEKRLIANSGGRPGSYLIRESDGNSYVLSYLGVTGINHFRISASCGEYYIGNIFHLSHFLIHLNDCNIFLLHQAVESSILFLISSDSTQVVPIY